MSSPTSTSLTAAPPTMEFMLLKPVRGLAPLTLPSKPPASGTPPSLMVMVLIAADKSKVSAMALPESRSTAENERALTPSL